MNLLDDIDLYLIRELETDATQTATNLAAKLSVSRPTIHFRLNRLLTANIIKILAVSDPLAFGYKTRGLFGINTHPAKIDQVANQIASNRLIRHVAVYTGQYDLQAWGIFDNATQMSDFARKDLGGISGITSIETMLNLKILKATDAILATETPPLRNEPPQPPLDKLDIAIMRHLREDGLQTRACLAEKTMSSPTTVKRRLDRLLNERIVKIVAIADPIILGYSTRATIGVKAHPNRVESVANQLARLNNVHHVLINTGQHDIIAWTDFQKPEDLWNFVKTDLSQISGLDRHETMICLKIIKDDFTFAARTY